MGPATTPVIKMPTYKKSVNCDKYYQDWLLLVVRILYKYHLWDENERGRNGKLSEFFIDIASPQAWMASAWWEKWEHIQRSQTQEPLAWSPAPNHDHDVSAWSYSWSCHHHDYIHFEPASFLPSLSACSSAESPSNQLRLKSSNRCWWCWNNDCAEIMTVLK